MLTHLWCSSLIANELVLDLWAEGLNRDLVTEDGVVQSRISGLEDGGVAYIDDRRLTSLVVERTSETEWKVNTVIDNEETVGLSLFGKVSSSDWLTIRFSDFKSNPPGLPNVSGFDPYNIPFDMPYLFTKNHLHVLQPGRSYPFEMYFGSGSATAEFLITAEAIPKPIPGDANLDGEVAFDDFLALAQNYRGGVDFTQQARGWTTGDFDQDGYAAFRDFLILAENFGKTKELTAAAVPEPTGVGSLLVGCLLCLRAFRTDTTADTTGTTGTPKFCIHPR